MRALTVLLAFSVLEAHRQPAQQAATVLREPNQALNSNALRERIQQEVRKVKQTASIAQQGKRVLSSPLPPQPLHVERATSVPSTPYQSTITRVQWEPKQDLRLLAPVKSSPLIV